MRVRWAGEFSLLWLIPVAPEIPQHVLGQGHTYHCINKPLCRLPPSSPPSPSPWHANCTSGLYISMYNSTHVPCLTGRVVLYPMDAGYMMPDDEDSEHAMLLHVAA